MKTSVCEGDGTILVGETNWAVTPFGGLAVFMDFWTKVDLLEAVLERGVSRAPA